MMKISPYIRLAWDDWWSPHMHLSWRVIFDYEIICLKSGEIEFILDDRVYHARPGDILFIRPKQRHILRTVGDEVVHQPHIHFDMFEDEYSQDVYISYEDIPDIRKEDMKLFREDIMDELLPGFPSLIRTESFVEIEALMMNIINEIENRCVYFEMIARGMMLELLTVLLRTVNEEKERSAYSRNMDIAVRVHDYLNDNLNRDVSLDDIAGYVYVSKYYLCRHFKQYYGISPIQYHLKSRINRAKRLLVGTNMSISDISESLGFQNIYSFSRTFKKYERISPSIYRKG